MRRTSPALALAALTVLTASAAPARADETPAEAEKCGVAPPRMSCIPGGPFIRGSNDGPANTRPQATVWIETFYMDKHEVTFGEYQACVAEKKCRRSKPFYNDFSRPRQPMVAMTWFDAVRFCRARGKHLPTEAEWEKAARGPSGELYPWGNEPADCTRAVIRDERGRSCGVKKEEPDSWTGRTFEVGSRPAFRYGLHDMSGNAWEWVADWYSPSYRACGRACLGKDPRGPCDGASRCPGHEQKIVRGGSWYWPKQYATAVYRRPNPPNNRPYHHFGFRCAASPAEARAIVDQPKPARGP